MSAQHLVGYVVEEQRRGQSRLILSCNSASLISKVINMIRRTCDDIGHMFCWLSVLQSICSAVYRRGLSKSSFSRFVRMAPLVWCTWCLSRRRTFAHLPPTPLTTPLMLILVSLSSPSNLHQIFIKTTGEGALRWALQHGFVEENILTPSAKAEWQVWADERKNDKTEDSHDTVGIIVLDGEGRLAAGTSTSGWKFKLAGRVSALMWMRMTCVLCHFGRFRRSC